MQQDVQQRVQSGLGQALATAREKRGTTLAEAAAKLRVDVAVLEALEGERFDELGAPVFVRGHLRHYAELLGESPDAMQALYAGHDSAGLEPDLTRAPRIKDRRPARVRSPRGPKRSGWRLAIGIGLLVLAGALWWGLVAQAAP